MNRILRHPTDSIHGSLPANAAPPPGRLDLRSAERVVDALNQALDHDGDPREQALVLLSRYRDLLGRDCDTHLILHDDLGRPAGPHVMDRVVCGPRLERMEPRTNVDLQRVIDSAAPVVRMIIPDALSNLHEPRVFVVGEDLPPEHREWYRREWVEQNLTRHGWSDLMIGAWTSSPDEMIGITAYLPTGAPPFDDRDRRLASLMVRAAAPLLQRELFNDGTHPLSNAPERFASPMEGRELSDRQRDVLRLLLQGHSEKEVARDLGVSTHTVHTHVKRLYTEFDVSSRGELLALFIDRRILRQAG